MQAIYPFTAIVGQQRMRRALVLNAIDQRIGGVLIRGERGTAKSTAARGLAALLPEIEVFAESPFNDDPNAPDTWSDWVHERRADDGKLKVTKRKISFVDLPVSATEDRVVGTLDIEQAIQKGERHFEPGVLASANRGLLYIDEVNLLDDHVVDLLLDSAAMGVNIVEREGISFTHPARFILIGTMNPEEGDLRPQLLDRFALAVDIQGIRDSRQRVQIMERNLAFESDAEKFYAAWQPKEKELADKIMAARELLEGVGYTSRDLVSIAALTSSLHVDGHRGDLVILKAARAQAAFDGRQAINDLDIAIAAELALAHRIKRGPFNQAEITVTELEERISELQGQAATQGEAQPSTEEGDEPEPVKKKDQLDPRISEATEESGPVEPGPQEIFDSGDARWWDGGQKITPTEEFVPRKIDNPLDKITRRQSGRRSRTHTDRKRGRYIQARPAKEKDRDIAFDATLRAAAPHQVEREERRKKVAFAIEKQDLQRKVRVRRAANLVLFVVDASWSMAVAERMAATKGAILSLLTDAYQRRDRVGLIVFQKDRANLILPPTNSIQLAQRALADIPVGGKTPLSAGLFLAHEVITRETRLHPEVMPLMILLTDGAGNVAIGDGSPQEEAHNLADQIADAEIRSVVINMEHAAFDQGLANALAEHLKSPCYTLQQLKAEHLYRAVKAEIDRG
jgi:magnesium chelatase subunit D